MFTGGRNAYKFKQSHLKAAEDVAHILTLLATEQIRDFSERSFLLWVIWIFGPLEACLHTHPCPGPWLTGSWKSAWCCPTGRWAAGEASDYLQDGNNTGTQELWKNLTAVVFYSLLKLGHQIKANNHFKKGHDSIPSAACYSAPHSQSPWGTGAIVTSVSLLSRWFTSIMLGET